MTILIMRGNALDLQLPDSCVDLVVTSPPYFGLRSYQDGGEHYSGQIGAEPTPTEFVDALIAATREVMRVLKPSGSIWVNLGDKYDKDKSLMDLPHRYAIRCRDDLRLIKRAEVIWSKPNGLPESVTDRVRRSHEVWFHFTKSPRYYSAVDEIREPYAPGTADRYASGYNVNTDRESSELTKGYSKGDGGPAATNPLGKLPGSVWTIPTQPLKVPPELGIDHFAAFPMEWPRRIIAGWSPAGGVVFDPFGGTGTTALMADVLGRDAISVDLSEDYCRLARWRTTDPKERAKAEKKVREATARPQPKNETPEDAS